ncbi:MAG: GDSL-type esterase/lipase family protein [Nitrososphaerota archaeon]|nr:GDSL-type esterase/lipase family protein [Nitrososphaerota archaeon]
MNKKLSRIVSVGIIILLASSGITACLIGFIGQTNDTDHNHDHSGIRVACVGDSLTQSTEYPYQLMGKLGKGYDLHNFGVGGTTVALASETPYMNTKAFLSALDFNPEIVIIMLGTNDAQPSLFQYNTTFVDDYTALIRSFQRLPSNPKIWLVQPPPIFSDCGGAISPTYFEQTILPSIKQVGSNTNLQVIDVYSLLVDHPEYFPDGIHPTQSPDISGNEPAAQIIATAIHKAITAP